MLVWLVLCSVYAVDLPQQVHIAYAGKHPLTALPTGISLSWQTNSQTLTLARLGLESGNYSMEYAGLSSSYFQTWDHHVVIEDLEPKTRYFYRVGNEQDGWSQEFSFVTASNDLSDPIRAVVIGDMGIFNSEDTIAALTGLVDSDSVDMILHVGDISYADDSFLKHPFEFGYEKVWNSYMQSIQQFAARVPYMTLPGNHEAECHSPACFISEDKLNKLSNFSAYNNRFRMPSAESGGALNMWYSFNLGPVHFINLDTETDFEGAPIDHFTLGRTNGGFGDQTSWLKSDLVEARSTRSKRPWILVSGHRPIYSVASADDNGFPTGPEKDFQKAFESIFAEHHIDIYMCGHVHGYERHRPMFNSVASLEQTTDVLINPDLPIYIVNGAGGNVEGLTSPTDQVPDWNVVNEFSEWGYGLIEADINTLRWSFYSAKGKMIDSVKILKPRL